MTVAKTSVRTYIFDVLFLKKNGNPILNFAFPTDYFREICNGEIVLLKIPPHNPFYQMCHKFTLAYSL